MMPTKTTPTVEQIRADLASGRAVLRYAVVDEAWYGKTAMQGRDRGIVRELSIGVDVRGENGCESGTYGEGSIVWIDLSREHAAQLRLYHDAWRALGAVPGFWDLLTDLGDERRSPTLDEVRARLEAIGFRDFTAREDPYAS
jgi:hypothetical protein